MPKRLVGDRPMLSKAIRALIKLFYSGEFSKPSDKWSWPVIHKAIGDFLAEIYGGAYKSGERKKGYLVLVRQKSKWGKIEKIPHPIDLDKGQISIFVKIMNALREEINNEEYVHLFLITAVDHIVSTLDTSYKEPVEESNILKRLAGSGEVIYKWGRDSSKRILQVMDRAAIEGVTKKRPRSFLKDSEIKEMTVVSSYERTFHVRVDTDFGKKYLLEKSAQYSEHVMGEVKPGQYKEEELFMGKVPYFQPLNLCSFIDIVRTLLVNFHLAFDDLRRLKICQNPDCHKLFYERREGRGKWCGRACRKRGDPKTREKRKCREKQNIWAVRKENSNPLFFPDLGSLKRVKSDDCKNCPKCEKGGQCLEFLKKNKEILSKLKEFKESEKNPSRTPASV